MFQLRHEPSQNVDGAVFHEQLLRSESELGQPGLDCFLQVSSILRRIIQAAFFSDALYLPKQADNRR